MIVNPVGKPKLMTSRMIYYVLLVEAAAVAMSLQLNGNWMNCHGTMK